MTDFDSLYRHRIERWRQTPETKVGGPDEAAALINEVGIATAFPASPEIPNLYHAYVGDPGRKTEAAWDTPTGTVYTWRWHLGRKDAAFYGVIVRKRPTFVAWTLLASVLRLWADPCTPDELYDVGKLSPNAYRIAQVLEESGGVLTTRDLRDAAGFPAGKEQRAAYVKAVEELDSRLLLAKVFSPDDTHDEEMGHALVSIRFREHADVADRMTREDALEAFLRSYLPPAGYALPTVLARHLKLQEVELRDALERLVEQGHVQRISLPRQNGYSYVCCPTLADSARKISLI